MTTYWPPSPPRQRLPLVPEVTGGCHLDGVKHVLGIWLQTSEGAKFWVGVCAELANRGVRDVLIVCCDGRDGIEERARSRRCW